MKEIVSMVDEVITHPEDESRISSVKSRISELCSSFPVYGNFEA
jgi:glycine/serine hydroxymethyltransferase